tara:strand:+ start:3353 stop:3916 length:564 start_codon:yes stop_codon:yes gene_type:complete
MAFTINGQQIYVGKSFTHNGAQYPTNWHTVFSQEQKDAFGIVSVADPEPESYDQRFYWGVGNPKRLEDENAVDENGDPFLDSDGNQIVNIGLKTQWVATQKNIAGGLLASTDWYVTRKSESDVAIPTNISTYRASVRTICGTREAQINACTTTDELAALFTNRPVVENAEGELVTNTEPFITPWPEL